MNPYASLEPRVCPRCCGTRVIHDTFENRSRRCLNCNGAFQFYPPDLDKILAEIKGRKGLRSARPKEARSYYVWRMARFHGGVDVTMPVMADLELGRDPFKKELDEIADQVAKVAFGTDMAAANRWSRALGYC